MNEKNLSTKLKSEWIAEKLNLILKRGDPERLGREISADTIRAKATPREIDWYYYNLKGESHV